VLSLDEWCFEFTITASAPIPHFVADDLLWEAAIGWAESRHLGIGDGCRPAAPEVEGAALAWRFRFGLCVQADNGQPQTISESQAGELWDWLGDWCRSRGLLLAGQFHPFTPAECSRDI
jgi:hypothetical protein